MPDAAALRHFRLMIIMIIMMIMVMMMIIGQNSDDDDHDDDNDDDDGEREISRLLARRCDTLVWMSLEIKAQNAPHMAALVGQDGGGDDDSGREVDDD